MNSAADTIVAIATAPSSAHRAMIRASGPACEGLFRSLISGAEPARGLLPARFSLESRSFPVLAGYFPAPASFTGEDVLEIQMPGGPPLVARVMQILMGHPQVRHAEPGEFSARAYLNGKLTLDQAEGIAQSIAATTADELAAATRLTSGQLGRAYAQLSDQLAQALALSEACIDFSDQEDVVLAGGAQVSATLEQLAARVNALVEGRAGQPNAGEPIVAIVGEPNAGKSTLFNAMMGRIRAVTSPIRGTTRDALRERLHLASGSRWAGWIWLMDTPGVEPTPGDSSLPVFEHADVILWCDPTGAFPHGFAPAADGSATIRVRTKADVAFARSAEAGIEVCALDGRGISELIGAIARAIASLRPAATPQARHAACLRRVANSLEEAHALIAKGPDAPIELTASALRIGLDALGELTGRVDPDRILGLVFSRFCIGK
ncbi:MAG: 50S ribosome-binding GTPase [Phycisphaeraceae bacterium]|nr:50S ribosome-binding GTPase [Phycisphaeraceae bacterium]